MYSSNPRRFSTRRQLSRRKHALLETLEPRQLLAANDPFINEFLANNNTTTFLDDNNVRTDWIEIKNPGSSAVDLTGWHLTDSKSVASKWTFPAGTTIAAGGYLVVFADGSLNPIGPGGKLHANFSLDADGEYLAMTRPDNSVVNSFDPFPKQKGDISYGSGPQSVSTSTVLNAGASSKTLIPTSGSLGTTWTQSGFDDSTWIAGNTGVGYEVPGTVNSFLTHMVDTSAGSFSNVGQARTVLNGNISGYTVAFDGQANDSVIDYGDGGNYSVNNTLPNGLGPGTSTQAGREQYAMRMTANVTIPVGTWTFEVNSNAGFLLTIPGVTFTARTGENATNATGTSSSTLVYWPTRSTGDTLGTVTVTGSPLTTTMTLDYFDSTGADYVEMAVASGSRTAFSAANFALLGNNVTPPGGTGQFKVSGQSVPQYTGLIATNVPQMQNANASAYVRVPFNVNPEDLTNLSGMTLRMKYDDGYVAYLNGVEIARKNAGGTAGTPLAYNATAASDRSNALALAFEDVDVSAFTNLLVQGQNVLSVQALNSSAGNNDLLMAPQLDLQYTSPPGLQYMTPTPGAANVAGSIGLAGDTNFSVDDGYYADPFDLQITTKQSNTTIYYTLDGRSPLNANGTVSSSAIKYTGPIHISKTTTLRAVSTGVGLLNSNVDTKTFLFAAQIITQGDASNVAGFPSKWIDQNGTIGSYPQSGQAKYGMTTVLSGGVPKYSTQELINDLESLPAISIVMNPDDLFGNGPTGTNGIKGIYSNPTQGDDANSTWERAMSAAMIFPDGTQGFQIDGGIQIQGGGSRNPSQTPKHSLRLVFKTKYGAPQLDYPVFGDDGVQTFDALILKAQYNNTWTHFDPNQRNRAQYVNDQWASDVEAAMGDPSKRGRYVQLYLNGVYWGMYSLTERPNDAWAADTLGGSKEEYDVYDNNAVNLAGNSAAFSTMFSLANQMISLANAGQSTDSVYQQLQQYLDVGSFIDFMMLNQYGGNQDWDDHNWYAVRRSRDASGVATNQYGGFRFIAFDSERILEGETQNVTTLNNDQRPTRLFQALKRNAEFRMQFADRVHQVMFNGGPLTPQNAQSLYVSETQKVYAALATEEERWGTYRADYEGDTTIRYSRDGQWANEFNRLTSFDATYAGANTGYFSVRGNELLKQYRTADVNALTLYPSFDAAEWNQFGGNVTAGFRLNVSNLASLPAGAILYYTTDGSDPRLPGGAIAPGALVYPGNGTGIVINASERIFMRVFVPSSSTWSASTVASFFASPAPRLRVTEILYNPKDAQSGTYAKDEYEFIELQNTGATPLDPSGITISDGIDFTFPDGSAVIPAGGRVVLVRNPLAFQERYGAAIAIAGTYSGELADGGERITLTTGIGQTIESFTYKDGWYAQTDGDGFALVANDPDAADGVLSTKDGWRSGQPVNGNPGGPDAGLLNNSIVINELMPTATVGGNWIEFKNTTDAAIDIGGWYLSDDSTNRQKYTIAAGTIVPAHGFVSIAQTGGFGGAFALSSLGGAVYLTSSDGAGGVGGYRDAVDYGASDPDVSFGKYVKSTGGSDFTAMSAATRGAENSYPLVGPVVINEVMYNPFGLDREYIELRNVTDAAVSLAGWTFSDGINFTFPAGTSIPADGYVLIVPIDPAVFRSTYNIPANVQIFGPFTGALNNGGEKITLSKPGAPVNGVTPLITVDRINYDNTAPWPTLPDGTGPSVARISATKYGNDAANWTADLTDGTPGIANGTPPLLLSSGFVVSAPGPTVTLKFNKDVGASLAVGDLVFTNLTTGQAVAASAITFAYDSATQTATWQLAANAADGNYRATMAAAGVTDAQGRTLDGNGDGVAGDAFSTDFYLLGGDANRDRTVDFNDLVRLAQNYNTSGKTYSQGDFNLDGTVDFQDLVILAQHYNSSLAAPAAGSPAGAMVAASPISAAVMAANMGFGVPTTTTPTPSKASDSSNVNAGKRTKPGPATKPEPPVKPKPATKPEATKAQSQPQPVTAAPVAASRPAVRVMAAATTTTTTTTVTVASPPGVAVFANTFGKKKISTRVFS